MKTANNATRTYLKSSARNTMASSNNGDCPARLLRR